MNCPYTLSPDLRRVGKFYRATIIPPSAKAILCPQCTTAAEAWQAGREKMLDLLKAMEANVRKGWYRSELRLAPGIRLYSESYRRDCNVWRMSWDEEFVSAQFKHDNYAWQDGTNAIRAAIARWKADLLPLVNPV